MSSPDREVLKLQRALTERIVSGALPPGVRLPAETALAKEFGCGRSTVREALGQLASSGLVESRRGSGAHVLDWRRRGTPALLPTYLPHAIARGEGAPLLLELLSMRRLLAKEAVRLAARYAKPAALAAVRETFERSAAERDPRAAVTLELEVFRALLTASELWPVVWFSNSFWGPMLELHATYAFALGGPPSDYAEAMGRLLDLVEKGREDAALREVDRYLDRVDEALANTLADAADGPPPSRPPPSSPPPRPTRKQPPTKKKRP
jgi:DNA-binding FadR family transcriptional regulator